MPDPRVLQHRVINYAHYYQLDFFNNARANENICVKQTIISPLQKFSSSDFKQFKKNQLK